MDPTAVAERLESDDEVRTVTALPDGSVDTFYEVTLAGERVDTREAFGEAARGEWSDVFGLERTAREPGGHAPNLAAQAARLGNDATLAGFLDHRIFQEFPCETVSMGEPASVAIHEFDDGDVLTVERSDTIESWTLADLQDALGGRFQPTATADAVCCVNWTSLENLPAELDALADEGLDGEWLLVDPGAPPGGSNSDVEALLGALERLEEHYDVVLSVNPAEAQTLAGGAGIATDDADEVLEGVRSRAGITAVVEHGERRGAAATSADRLPSVENFDVEAARSTGGGDRFDAGLVHALARDWDWEAALALGNACASRYVATGETGTVEELADFLRGRG